MAGVLVLILHPQAGPTAGPLEQWVATLRGQIAERHRNGFQAAGADRVVVVAGPPDDTPFGSRLRGLIGSEPAGGAVVLGSGAVPLISGAERGRLVEVARSDTPRALANSRFSADVVAVAPAEVLCRVPDAVSDNGLPRWLEVATGARVEVMRRWQLGIDVDGPLDALLLARARTPETDVAGNLDAARPPAGVTTGRVAAALAGVAAVAARPRAELVVAGRTSAGTLAWLERGVAARVRAFVEERGLRSIAGRADRTDQRPARSLLGALLDRDGPHALGRILAELGEGAVVDSRVLIAHRFGREERRWPPAEDRFASDLLLHERVTDPWLRELTTAAAAAPIPIVLGGHTLVGPGLRLALRPPRRHD